MDEIINYIMETPGNTNPNVLRGILETSGGGGSGGGALVINVSIIEGNKFIMDKTAGEVYEAAQTGIVILAHNGLYTPIVASEFSDKGGYTFQVSVPNGNWAPGVFTATTSSDYPITK